MVNKRTVPVSVVARDILPIRRTPWGWEGGEGWRGEGLERVPDDHPILSSLPTAARVQIITIQGCLAHHTTLHLLAKGGWGWGWGSGGARVLLRRPARCGGAQGVWRGEKSPWRGSGGAGAAGAAQPNRLADVGAEPRLRHRRVSAAQVMARRGSLALQRTTCAAITVGGAPRWLRHPDIFRVFY